MTILYDGGIFADYHQFFLQDAGAADGGTAAGDAPEWTDATLAQGVLPQPGGLSVSTARNMTVPVRVTLHAAPPALPLEAVDHAVEAGLHSQGTLILAGCTDYLPDAARLTVPPGSLRVLLLCHGLGSLSEDGLDGDDRYELHLWPAPGEAVVVHKGWETPPGP